MRLLLWVALAFAVVAGVILPVTYLAFVSRLPQLESEYDLEALLRGYIEGERLNQQTTEAGAGGRTPEVRWTRPEFSVLPRDLVNLFLSEMSCPTFFQTPRESAWESGWRAFNAFFLSKILAGEDGRCELDLGARVASEARIKGEALQVIAAYRIRSFLTKDQLVAYALESFRTTERGVFGVQDASRQLFRRQLKDLSLAQLAELMLAVPPNGFYDDILLCRNPIVIRRARDTILTRAAESGLIAEGPSRAERSKPLTCTRE